jgi:hypothetical protein
MFRAATNASDRGALSGRARPRAGSAERFVDRVRSRKFGHVLPAEISELVCRFLLLGSSDL